MHTIKVIITKYALTSGPIIAEGTPDPQSKTRMLEVNRSGSGFQRTDYYHRQDWQTTKEDAIKNVMERAAQRRLSLEKQIEKLDSQLAKAWNTINEMDL